MCGIVGYVGKRNAQELIYKGLEHLEYRGYDSAGIAALRLTGDNQYSTTVLKVPGKLRELKKQWQEIDFPSEQAIGHTRWATHGEANQVNAHPHRSGAITIVHNGIIENHQNIREELRAQGVNFKSETDSELFGHLVSRERDRGTALLEAVRLSFLRLQGASAFVVMDERLPGTLVVVRNGSPLVIGLGKNENFVASDVPAILENTREIYYLDDNELAEITANKVKIFTKDGKEKGFEAVHISWSLDAIDKMGYPHYMLKEIFEQPRALTDTLSSWLDLANGRFRLEAVSVSKKSSKPEKKYTHEEIAGILAGASEIRIVACGTAWHAGLYGAILFEKVAKIRSRAERASEFRYREPVLVPSDIGLVVSQSGETADTLAAVKLMKEKGMRVFAVCNVRDSSIARECDGVFYTNAGIEIGVASTKAFTTQMAVLAVLAGALAAYRKSLSPLEERRWVEALGKLPKVAKAALDEAPSLNALSNKYKDKKGFLFLGRGGEYPIALEGALKLKEIAYVHAEGYPSGELKHGPIAMVEPEMVVIAIAPEGSGLLHAKSVSNIEEVKARKGTLLGLGSADDTQLKKISDSYVNVPGVGISELIPILAVLPLQLFAYYVATARGTEVDQPRNLAKSVTVE